MKSKSDEQKLYECVLITSYGEIDNIMTSVVAGIYSDSNVNSSSFSILRKETWGKRTLAYKINKNKKGYYSAIYVSSTSDALKVFDRNLRMHQDIIRFLILSVDEVPSKLPPIAHNIEN
jgi:small subunit ribosomal protein S6